MKKIIVFLLIFISCETESKQEIKEVKLEYEYQVIGSAFMRRPVDSKTGMWEVSNENHSFKPETTYVTENGDSVVIWRNK